MEKDWVKIYSTRLIHKVKIIKAVLAENGINAVEINKQDSSYLIFGEIELYVKKDDETFARFLIKENNL